MEGKFTDLFVLVDVSQSFGGYECMHTKHDTITPWTCFLSFQMFETRLSTGFPIILPLLVQMSHNGWSGKDHVTLCRLNVKNLGGSCDVTPNAVLEFHVCLISLNYLKHILRKRLPFPFKTHIHFYFLYITFLFFIDR